jgi:hypothetical protein
MNEKRRACAPYQFFGAPWTASGSGQNATHSGYRVPRPAALSRSVTKRQRAVWQASPGYPRNAQQCYDDVIGNVPVARITLVCDWWFLAGKRPASMR